MSGLFHAVIYDPIYNLLVFLTGILPGGDIGLAVVIATVIVKVILMPLSLRAARTQKQMKVIQPQLNELKEKHKNDRQKQATEMLALYREHQIKPFASILGVLIQLPIIFALYFVSLHALRSIDPALLYSFVQAPAVVSPYFLGFLNIATQGFLLAIIAAVFQYLLSYFSIPVPERSEKPSAGEDFGRAMAVQARYVLPLIIGVVAYTSGVVALYFITSAIVGLIQEAIVRTMKHPMPVTA